MMDKLWVVLLVALIGAHLGHGLPVRSTPHSYPHNTNGPIADGWTEGSLYAAVPALALIITAVGLLIGCTWCYRHKDCKQNEGADNQLFTASATHLHERRSHPPDSGFSEPANNNISEDNNNGPISLREMQNIANNNAAAYIVSENEERNRVSRESVVEFEPLPTGIRVADPLERCVDWFGDEDFPRNRLQYLREIGRGAFGRVVEGEIEDEGTTTTVAVKILNQNASLEDKARFLEDARIYRDSRHENVLAFVASCLQEDPWILIFELCPNDLQTYLTVNRPKMAELNENGVPLRLMCDVTAALSYLHSRGNTYGYICASNVLVRGEEENARAVLGHYGLEPRPQSPEHAPTHHTDSADVHSLGTLIWEICAWGAPAPRSPPPDLNCPYREHLYQVMQLCWNANPAERPTAAQTHALLNHLYTTHNRSREATRDDGYGSSDFEERWQRLKPNTIPKIDEHVAIVHAPSTSMASHFTGSEEFDNHTVQDTLSVDLDPTAVSRSSSMMSDKDPLSVQIKSESLTNLHGSLEDVGNIYLTHNERAIQDCHQGNVGLDDTEHDRSDASVDPWLKEIIAGNQDDDGYYRDVSDVIKNLDNILNSEKTSSSESSHQASPSRDNLSLDCKKDYPMQSSMVKSPGISNFQNILEIGFEGEPEKKQDEDEDRDTIGTLSHSFERHSDTTSQQTLENLTPDTPIKDMDLPNDERIHADLQDKLHAADNAVKVEVNADLPKESKIGDSFSELPNLTDLNVASIPSINKEESEVCLSKDCQSRGDNLADIVNDKETVEAKSICEVIKDPVKSKVIEEVIAKNVQSLTESSPVHVQNKVLPVVSELTENDKVPLPSAPLDDKDTAELRPEPTSANSQNDINNDLITPAESTTDSKVIQIDAVSFETEVAPKLELVVSFSEIPEPTHSLEETDQGELPPPIFDLKEESLPETVQNNTTCVASFDSDIPEGKSDRERSLEPASEIETLALDVEEKELVQLITEEARTERDRVLNSLETPTLIFSEPLDDVQDSKSIENVPEEFVEKIIKEAETAALISIETGEAKITPADPENFSKCKDSSINTFLENEIRSMEIESLNNIAFQEHLSDTFKTPESKGDSLSVFPEKESKIVPGMTPEDSDVDEIARKILLEAMHDVPKAMDKVEPPPATVVNNVAEIKNDTSLTYLHSTSEGVTEKFSEPLSQKQDSQTLNRQKISILTEPSPTTNVELNKSVSSPQNNVVNKEVTEEWKSVVTEDPKPLLEETIQKITSPAVSAEPVLNTASENNTKFEKNMSMSEGSVVIVEKYSTKDNTPLRSDENKIDTLQELSNGSPTHMDLTNGLKTDILEHNSMDKGLQEDANTCVDNSETKVASPLRSDEDKGDTVIREQSNNSTTYMDLTDDVNTVILKNDPVDKDLQEVIDSCLHNSETEAACSLVKNESTEYLDLPNVIREMDAFLHSERQLSSPAEKDPVCASTPKSLTDDQKSEQDRSDVFSETKVPHYGPGVTLTKLEQQCVPDSMSPFESPTKSHPTDTYDENSSVVLGPFENCTMELFKGVKSATDVVDVPKDELLAFSSNFSEMNLETPSPLRDGNFLNEVPDIVHDDIHFDDVTTEPKEETDPKTDVSDATDQSLTEKRVSPSTPPNSPGYFLASTSQQKYLVDIDLNHPTEAMPVESDSGLSSLHKEIDLNQIELQITSKLAMAENENNVNIEYSGPLTVEGLVQDDLEREEESVPETFLAGYGGGLEDMRENFTLDEACVNALRNELELKLPLAQVATIEPQCESEGDNSWSGELPPPPELIVSYPGALSPIAEETGPQLSAYENDAQWNTSIRTDSSESYPEPCNNSTDEVTELPTGQNTYTLPSRLHTYTVQKDATSSKEITMSADSLNGSPRKSNAIDDRTFTKEDDHCERISQVSPFVLSPTTDTSAPDNSDVTGVSTLSKTTVPTDAKISKPSETQCLSKATSIDSWCSNDTLYNVEEAFDDLASDPDLPEDFDVDKEQDNSESSHTLTVNDEKELSHVSTYIVHDSQSDEDRFSPDSITANDHDNYTYTKVKTDVETSPSVITKSEVNDSKTQTKDLAYGTLMSGVPSYSNCTTEVLSGDNCWLLPQPELVRRSPIEDGQEISAAITSDDKKAELEGSPQLKNEPCLRKMDSVEITCLEDHLLESSHGLHGSGQSEFSDSPNYNYMAETVTSTPLTEVPSDDKTAPIPMTLPEEAEISDDLPSNLPNLQSFLYSAELRPQNSFGTNEKRPSAMPEGEGAKMGSDSTPSYTEFEHAATSKPQDMSRSQSSQNGSDDYMKFEKSLRSRPQDMSTSASEKLLHSERGHSSESYENFENAMRNCPQDMSAAANETQPLGGQIDKEVFARPSQPNKSEPTLAISPPNITNLRESHVGKVNTVIMTDLEEDETEQPHSIIIAEISKDGPNRTYDSHLADEFNHTYDSHPNRRQKDDGIAESTSDNSKEITVNGLDNESHTEDFEVKSPEAKNTEETEKGTTQVVSNTTTLKDVPNGSVSNLIINHAFDIKCNGNSEKFATVNFINETFEELVESNVDDGDSKDGKSHEEDISEVSKVDKLNPSKETVIPPENNTEVKETVNGVEEKMVAVTENFLENEKKFCRLDAYLPLLSDIRFTGPASEIMSTSFTQESPTEPAPDRDDKPGADIKEWDSDSESHSSNSSSGEFIWKGGDGQETSVVPSTHFDHRGSNGGSQAQGDNSAPGVSSGDSGSASGSEGDEVEFVPSSWDCRAEPAKSSLRSLAPSQDNKKRVVFKRQKYHCVYEYPRELAPSDAQPVAYLPDLSTYTEWDTTSAEEAELGYGQLFGAPSPLDLYPLRGTVGFGAEYDDEFFVTPSARPFESLGVFSTTSQFFPGGMPLKPGLHLPDDLSDDFPPPPSPLSTHPLAQTRTPSLDFTTPDSGVEDITPVSTSTDEDFKTKKLPEAEVTQWRSVDSGSSSESVSPSSPGGEALGGLRHTRDKLKLDLPPSPHIPSPRHNRVFNFVLDKPKRHRVPDEKPVEIGTTPLVMTDETPVVSTSLPLQKDCEDIPVPEPTFSTFGKCAQKNESEQKMILTDDVQGENSEEKNASPVKVEAVKGEGTVLDSGDEDSGIESSSKATLERNKTPNVS